MTASNDRVAAGVAGAFGVNYALRPHKFIDRRIFVEILARFSNFQTIDDYAYVGLGSFAMEDHKLMNAAFGISEMISLEIDEDVFKRQIFNLPLACIRPTLKSTNDFVAQRTTILQEAKIDPDSNVIAWFDMTDAMTLRACLDCFEGLLGASLPGDIIRMTVDIDEKTLGRLRDNESLDELFSRRFDVLREMLDDQLRTNASVEDMKRKLGVAELVAFAFGVASEKSFQSDAAHEFLPISITTYADGHRMLSVTGAVVERDNAQECRQKMSVQAVPGGVASWDELIDVEIPQLTVWEKLALDRQVHIKTSEQLAATFDFKLHETISTVSLIENFVHFQRFYPTFRHVLL